jgi:hypothetical protein
MPVHNRRIRAAALLLSAALFSLAAWATGDSAVKLLVRSGKLVQLTSAQVTLDVGDPERPQRITFAINQTAQLDHSAKPGQMVNVIYARRRPMDVIVKLIALDRAQGSSNSGAGSEPLGVASIKVPEGERTLSDHDAAQIMLMVQVIQPRSSPPPVKDGAMGTIDGSSHASSQSPNALDDKDSGSGSPSSSELSGWMAHGGTSPLTNGDVIRIVKSGGGEKMVISQIERASSVNFDLSFAGIENLRSSGVSEATIAAMKKRSEVQNPIIK